MNVRITPRGEPQRTDLYAGIETVRAEGDHLRLRQADVSWHKPRIFFVPLCDVAELALDDDPGGGF